MVPCGGQKGFCVDGMGVPLGEALVYRNEDPLLRVGGELRKDSERKIPESGKRNWWEEVTTGGRERSWWREA